jgi:hypothetical protein
MLISLLFKAFFYILAIFVFWLPNITTLNISVGIFNFPIDTYLSTGMGYVFFIINAFPPLGIIYNGFLAVLTWRALVLFLKILPVVGRIFKK